MNSLWQSWRSILERNRMYLYLETASMNTPKNISMDVKQSLSLRNKANPLERENIFSKFCFQKNKQTKEQKIT